MNAIRLRDSLLQAAATGAMRRTHLRHHDNISKRLPIHIGGFNLSLVMRKLVGKGTPRGLQGLSSRIFGVLWAMGNVMAAFGRELASSARSDRVLARQSAAA